MNFDHSRGTGDRARTMLLFCGIMLAAGCGAPQIERNAFELAKAIDTLCNLRADDQLPKARSIVDAHRSDDKIDAAEHAALCEILNLAEKGEWRAARQASRDLLLAQNQSVRR